MRICHVIYIPRLSGAEILVRDLTLSHISMGNQVAIISIQPPETSFANEIEQLQDAGALFIFPKMMLGKLSRLAFLGRELKKLNPDVAIAHSVIPSAYVRLVLKLIGRKDIPTVTVLHNASQDDYASKYWRSLEKWVIPPPSYLIALTETAKHNYQKRIGDRTKIEVIPNGINLKRFSYLNSVRNEVRETIFRVKNGEKVFLQIGRFGSTKQQHLSVSAFISAFRECSYLLSAKLFLVGLVEDSQYYQNLKKKVADSGLEEAIVFLGACTNVPELLAGADVYLMPSKREAHSVAFLEALASGITIIASDIAAFQHGRYFPGVTLIQPDNIKLFSEEISNAANQNPGKLWERNLKDYSIDKTSHAYLHIFNFLSTNR
ncbi:glycosyltransferase family 4 protein [Merismopedia glauca]